MSSGLFGGLFAAIPTPLDWLLGGMDGTYGVIPDFGDPRGFGPLPAALVQIPQSFAQETVFMGWLW
jgi:hypothetical protein